MSWKFTGNTAIYLQIIDRMILNICSGKYPPGGRIPSVRQLSEESGANPNTVQRAMMEMDRMGILEPNGTLGRVVRNDGALVERYRRDLTVKLTSEYLGRMRQIGCTVEEIHDLIGSIGSGNPEAGAEASTTMQDRVCEKE